MFYKLISLLSLAFVYFKEAYCEIQLTHTIGFSILSSDVLCRTDLDENRLLLGENFVAPLVSDCEPLAGLLVSSVFQVVIPESSVS